MTDWSQWLGPDAASMGPAETVRVFEPGDPTEDPERVHREGDGWRVDAEEQSWLGKLMHRGQSIPLFQVPLKAQSRSLLVYRAQVRAEGLKGRAYLEMWCRVNGREFFSKGHAFGQAVEGTAEWRTLETPFLIRAGEQADLARLNLAIEGEGVLWVRNVELTSSPLPDQG